MAWADSARCARSRPGIDNRYWLPAQTASAPKLRLAMDMGIHDTIGIDLVAMCVNDLVVAVPEPLFFLDYYATGTLHVDTRRRRGHRYRRRLRTGRLRPGGGETAEMPGHVRGARTTTWRASAWAWWKNQKSSTALPSRPAMFTGIASSGPHQRLFPDPQDPAAQRRGPCATYG